MEPSRTPCQFHGRGCRRTRSVAPHCAEWVCGIHWTLAPRPLRNLHRESKRQLQRLRVRHFKASRLGRTRARLARLLVAAQRRENRRWDAIKAAIGTALAQGAEAVLAARRRPRRDLPVSRFDAGFEQAFARLRGRP